jgi:FkbM family methyltransferase
MQYLRQILNAELPRFQIVDVGAATEGAPRYAPLLESGAATVACFEALEESCAAMKGLGPNQQIIPLALADGSLRDFTVTGWRNCSSFFQPDPAVIDLYAGSGTAVGDNYWVVGTLPVQTRRMDEFGLKPSLIKLDVQGGELMALEGGIGSLSNALIVEVEVSFVPFYKGQPLFEDVAIFMREHGFVLHKLVDYQSQGFRPFNFQGNQRRGYSQLIAADAIFIRPPHRLATLKPDQLLAFATIASDAYNSVDLAHLCLDTHDSATGSQFAGVYRRHAIRHAGDNRLLMNERTD